MAGGLLRQDVLTAYRNDGYVLARGMFDAGEIDLLRRSAKEDKTLDDHAYQTQPNCCWVERCITTTRR